MIKLIGSAATWGLPLVATALLSSCNSHRPQIETNRDTATQTQALGDEKAGLLDDAIKACGFTCTTLAEGNASISGNAKIDSYFQAVLALKASAVTLDAEVNGIMSDMALIVGAKAGANAKATAANIEAGFKANISANLEGGLTIDYQPPQCSVSADVAVQAKAQCEAMVDPGKVEVECHGECVAKANVMASCTGGAELKCRGTAPSFECEGECSGSCELDANVKCEGTCSGKCDLTAAGKCDGECLGSTDNGGNCTGECKVRAGAKCEGECKGSCELSGGAKCEGKCKGECFYTPPDAKCEASAQASCQAKGEASVHCEGECRGNVEPPMVSAECDATVKAQAQFSAECTPPDVKIGYKLKASVKADAKAQLEGKVVAFGKLYGKLLAKRQRINGILSAVANLGTAGSKAVEGLATSIGGDGDLKVAFKAGCALKEVPKSATIVTDSAKQLGETAAACGTVTKAAGDS